MSASNAPRFAHSTSDSYDRFMGRYSAELAPLFADLAGVHPPMTALDVGSGPGALAHELARRLGPESVSACDPSPTFVADCARRLPGVTVKLGAAEALPFENDAFDVTLAQLVLPFVTDPVQSVAEMKRVTRAGGRIGATVWDMTGGMEMLRAFGEATAVVNPTGEPVHRPVKFGSPGELAELFASAGLVQIDEQLLKVQAAYQDFEELWSTIQTAAGPTAAFVNTLDADGLIELRKALFERVGEPSGVFTLGATAVAVVGTRA